MKMKLFKYIGYLLFILLSLNSCVNEMNIMENEIVPEINNKGLDVSNPIIKKIIDYEGKEPSDEVIRIEKILDLLYKIVPQAETVIDYLVKNNLKVRIHIGSVSGSNMTSWYKSSYPPEIGFDHSIYITDANVLHELLHFYTTNAYSIYRGQPNACEEYEVRVLTDLLMHKYYDTTGFKYQGMRNDDILYASYKKWINDIVRSESYDIMVFKNGFKMYGTFCIQNFAHSDRPDVVNFNESELNRYTPTLMQELWFNYKR